MVSMESEGVSVADGMSGSGPVSQVVTTRTAELRVSVLAGGRLSDPGLCLARLARDGKRWPA